MINWERVNELREEIGSDDFDEVAEIFLEEVEEVVQKLHDHREQQEFQSSLHFLKGSAMNLGFQQFAEICNIGEMQARDQKFDPEMVKDMVLCYENSKTAFLAE